ncbi:MAG: hypothetical protein IT423_07910, partial [Pirellulaceae bacterium]|nr:hypothetical protein [Pirellulaceae bacterium]
MQIEFECSCGARMRTSFDNLGKKTKCPKCSAIVAIPDSAPLVESPDSVSTRTPANPVASRPVPAQPVPAQPVTARPVPAQPAPARPAPASSGPARPVPARPVPAQPVTAQRVTAQRVTAQRVTAQPVSARPVPARPVPARPIAAQPVAAPAASGFDPLALDPFDQLPMPGPSTLGSVQMGAGNWSAAAYAAPRRRQPKWLWPVVGLTGTGICGLVGLLLLLRGFSGTPSLSSASPPSSGTGSTNSPPAALGSQANSSGASAKPASPISEAEARMVGDRFIAAVVAANRQECAAIFRMDEIIDDLAKEVGLSARERSEFSAGFNKRGQYCDQILPAVAAGGKYELLRPVQRGNQMRLIVRLQSHDGGLNYHELIMSRAKDNSIFISDAYILTSGETMGESIRRLVIAMFAGRDLSLIGRLTGASRKMAENGKALTKITTLVKTAPQLALAEIKQLPPELQREKMVLIMKLTVTLATDSSEYEQTFEEYQRLFPG